MKKIQDTEHNKSMCVCLIVSDQEHALYKFEIDRSGSLSVCFEVFFEPTIRKQCHSECNW